MSFGTLPEKNIIENQIKKLRKFPLNLKKPEIFLDQFPGQQYSINGEAKSFYKISNVLFVHQKTSHLSEEKKCSGGQKMGVVKET